MIDEKSGTTKKSSDGELCEQKVESDTCSPSPELLDKESREWKEEDEKPLS